MYSGEQCKQCIWAPVNNKCDLFTHEVKKIYSISPMFIIMQSNVQFFSNSCLTSIRWIFCVKTLRTKVWIGARRCESICLYDVNLHQLDKYDDNNTWIMLLNNIRSCCVFRYYFKVLERLVDSWYQSSV